MRQFRELFSRLDHRCDGVELSSPFGAKSRRSRWEKGLLETPLARSGGLWSVREMLTLDVSETLHTSIAYLELSSGL